MPLKLLVNKGDSILVGDELIVKVVEIEGNRPQLEFVAPRHVKIVQVHADSTRQFKNANKEYKKPSARTSEPRGPLGDNEDWGNK